MGLGNRLWQMVRIQTEQWLRKPIDPELAVDKTLRSLQQDVVQVRQSLAQAIAQQKRTKRQCEHFQTSGQQWQQRATRAVQQGNDDLARSALAHSIAYGKTAQFLQDQLTQQIGLIGQMRELMVKLEHKLAALQAKKDLYSVRIHSAQISQQALNHLNQFDSDSLHPALIALEDQVLQLEARSQALMTLTRDDLDHQFAILENSHVVETELATLKTQP